MREERRANIGETGEPQMLECIIGGGGGACEHASPTNEPPTLILACLGGDANILTRGKGRKDMTELEGARDPFLRNRVHRQPGDVLARKDDFASGRLEHA